MRNNEYDHPAIYSRYSIIGIQHKTAAFPGYMWNWQHAMVQPPQAHSHWQIWQQRERLSVLIPLEHGIIFFSIYFWVSECYFSVCIFLSLRSLWFSLLYMGPNFTVTTFNETSSTAMCEVECLVNSRPLTGVSDDVEDLSPLIPSHFFLYAENCAWPWASRDVSIHAIRRWRQARAYM